MKTFTAPLRLWRVII